MNTLFTHEEMDRILDHLTNEIMDQRRDSSGLMVLGIQRRGVHLAKRLASRLEQRLGCRLPFGTLDINLYRDDWTTLHGAPNISASSIPTPIDDKSIILVDDVLFTGRTIRAALEAILDYGRPLRVELLALIDRGHRELPIQADYVGKTVKTAVKDRIDVLVSELDGVDEVRLVRAGEEDNA
jgi:pyrimidine operon attenuation protein/uracil phosphoribosyltransferase